jgi:hypothetical protein
MERFIKLQTDVLNWAEDRGIIDQGTALGQAIKTQEEAQELRDHTLMQSFGMDQFKDKNGEWQDVEAAIFDDIGDTLVTLIIQAEMQGVCILDALEEAYSIIAKRKGKMINGQFVKEAE